MLGLDFDGQRLSVPSVTHLVLLTLVFEQLAILSHVVNDFFFFFLRTVLGP